MYPSVYARARAREQRGSPDLAGHGTVGIASGAMTDTAEVLIESVTRRIDSRGITGSEDPAGWAVAPVAKGFRSALAVAGFPDTHSADQSGSPPLTGTVPAGVFLGTFCVS